MDKPTWLCEGGNGCSVHFSINRIAIFRQILFCIDMAKISTREVIKNVLSPAIFEKCALLQFESSESAG